MALTSPNTSTKLLVLMSGRLVTLDDLADEIQLIKKESSEIGTKVKIRDIEIKKMQESEGEALLPEDSYTFIGITTGKDTSWRHPN